MFMRNTISFVFIKKRTQIKICIQHIMFVSDYDLQTALMEALCRMATPAQRKAFADRWFSMEHVANAFVKICDLEFETVKSHTGVYALLHYV